MYLLTWFTQDGEVEEVVYAASAQDAVAWAEELGFSKDFMVETLTEE